MAAFSRDRRGLRAHESRGRVETVPKCLWFDTKKPAATGDRAGKGAGGYARALGACYWWRFRPSVLPSLPLTALGLWLWYPRTLGVLVALACACCFVLVVSWVKRKVGNPPLGRLPTVASRYACAFSMCDCLLYTKARHKPENDGNGDDGGSDFFHLFPLSNFRTLVTSSGMVSAATLTGSVPGLIARNR